MKVAIVIFMITFILDIHHKTKIDRLQKSWERDNMRGH